MADDNQNLTVLIKKADGSFARVPISDFQKMQTEEKPEPPKPQPQSPKLEPKLPVKPVEQSRVQESQPKPEPKMQQPRPQSVPPNQEPRQEMKKAAAPVNLPVSQKPEVNQLLKPAPVQPAQKPEPPKPKLENKLERMVAPKPEPEIKVEPKEIKPEPVSQPVSQLPKVATPPPQTQPQPKLKQKLPELLVKMDKEDAKSLLEEERPKGKLPFASNTRDKQVDEVLKNLSFKISAANSNRLRTIVQLFLKDVRSEDETRETLQRKEMDGGMGFTPVQVEEIIKKCTDKNAPSDAVAIPSLKPGLPINREENSRLEKEIPQVKTEAPFPAVSAPNNPFKHDSSFTQKPNPTLTGREMLDRQTTVASLEKAPIFPIKTKSEPESSLDFKLSRNETKTVMQDIAPSRMEVGPVDEIKFINLVDFRRLSSNAGDAAKRLKQKFTNLKDESIVLYYDALAAWHISPLYNDYIEAVSEAMSKRLPLAEVCQDKNRIQLPEITALLQMGKELS